MMLCTIMWEFVGVVAGIIGWDEVCELFIS